MERHLLAIGTCPQGTFGHVPEPGTAKDGGYLGGGEDLGKARPFEMSGKGCRGHSLGRMFLGCADAAGHWSASSSREAV
jgi:hypothetical protein